jgi:hypothetical protein
MANVQIHQVSQSPIRRQVPRELVVVQDQPLYERNNVREMRTSTRRRALLMQGLTQWLGLSTTRAEGHWDLVK